MTKKNFDKVVEHVWENRKTIHDFDYPRYGGVGYKVYRTFSSEAVDAMQNIWHRIIGLDCNDKKVKDCFKTKAQFASGYKQELRRIGEDIK